MSNGNDHPHFPPPPSDPPQNGASGSGAAKSADDSIEDSGQTGSTDSSASPQTPNSEDVTESTGSAHAEDATATQAMPAPSFGEDAGAARSEPASGSADVSGSEAVPDRPRVAPAGSHQNQPPQGPAPSGPQHPAPQQPGPPQPGSVQQPGSYGVQSNSSGQSGGTSHSAGQFGGAPYPGGQHQDSQYQNAAPYPGAPNQPGQPQPGVGPDVPRTGSGPSQAIPRPAPAPGFAGSQPAATRAEARPAKKKSRVPLYITLGAVGLVIILVLAGIFAVNSVNKSKYGPDTVAEDYVAALNEGDFAAAEKIAPSPRPEGTNLDLLKKDFTEASSAKIENAKVESSQVDGDKGTVVVSYELDGSTFHVELPAKKDGKQDLFFDKWSLTGPALNVISLDIPAADGLTVNDQDYTAKAGTTSFAVYPGNYEFSVPKSKWVSAASDTASVNFPQAFAPGDQPTADQVAPTTLNLDLSPTDAFQKEVQKQVESELKKCFDNKSIEPKCEFIKFDPTEIPVGGTDKKLDDLAKKDTAKWDVTDMPKVKASFGSGDTTTGSFFTEEPGKFNFSVQGKKSGSSYFSNGNTLSVSGSVKIEGEKLKVEFFDF